MSELVNLVQRWRWAVAVAIFVAGAFFTPQLGTSSPADDRVVLAIVAANTAARTAGRSPVNADDRSDEPDEAAGFTDLYGNEVTDAVATYTFDQAGSLYELHSPQTELPRLGIPKS
jgi:hypothetical protein